MITSRDLYVAAALNGFLARGVASADAITLAAEVGTNMAKEMAKTNVTELTKRRPGELLRKQPSTNINDETE